VEWEETQVGLGGMADGAAAGRGRMEGMHGGEAEER
jgi:hypothetical protein